MPADALPAARSSRSRAAALLLLVCAPTTARAQWSDDPGTNLVVAAGPTWSLSYTSAATPDGGFWVVWAEPTAQGSTVRVQRFDSAGYEKFGPDGLVALVTPDPTADPTDCVVLPDGDLVLCANGATMRMQRVGPDGALAYGATGLGLAHHWWSGRLEALGDDVVFVGNRASTEVISAQRFDASGAEVWNDWLTLPEFGRFDFDVATTGTDTYIAGYLPLTGTYSVEVGLQRIDAAGRLPWGPTATRVSGQALVEAGSRGPELQATTDGVAVGYSVAIAFALEVLVVQRVDSLGALRWGIGGVPITPTTAIRGRWDLDYDDRSDELVAAWTERELVFPSSPRPFTVRLQRIDRSGARRLAPEGLALAAYPSGTTFDPVDLGLGSADAGPTGRTAYVAWPDPVTTELTGAVVAPSGPAPVGPVTLASRRAQRFGVRALGARSGEPQGQVLWLEWEPTGGRATLRAQNLRADGSLGGPVGLGEATCAGGLNSAGRRATLWAEGSAVVSRGLFALHAEGLPPHTIAAFLYAPSAGLTPNPGGAAGDLCLGRPIGRGPLRAADAAGDAAERVDLASVPAPSGAVSIGAGETWHFQAWYRDTLPGGNTTSARQVVFL